MMDSLTYKPSSLSSEITAELDDAGLTLTGNGSSKRIEWASLKSARYWTMRMQAMHFEGLQLISDDDQKVELNLNTPLGSVGQDSRQLQFLTFLENILASLESQRPDMRIAYGQPSRNRWIYFILGLACLIFTVGMAVALLADRGNDLEEVMLPLGLMGLFGAFLSWSFRPTKPPVTLSIPIMKGVMARYQPGEPQS
ncbi:MAG: hypothetical protein CBB65_01545 [Hyphomonadaceae bacterium TMED5]|nr:hypothetical protein [Ponticaulis sp.]OUY01149.1 MAG: hypothetical protein CBB65_01545 [Hyphomonadaceae bacterium TMED5]|tara:strand:+ start:115765 stop:116355 length:591 start_codon:yes stop_codon:yes gene_type:complete